MDIGPTITPVAAFAAGLVTSIHCSVMCGPLGCALLSSQDSPPRRTQLAIAVYHGSRLASYTLIGGLLGAFGTRAAELFDATPVKLLPWMFAALFLLLAIGAERWIPQPRFLSRLLLGIRFRAGTSQVKAASMLGGLTPLIPCGPLYLVFGVALFSGSFFGGATIMAIFAIGTLPLFWLLQSQLLRLRFAPVAMARIRRGAALVAAILVAWRAAAHNGTGSILLDGILCH